MLLIGSRAIRFHFPEFREPRDWDLVATAGEIDELRAQLPEVAEHSHAEKSLFRLGGDWVEVANASNVPYWGHVHAVFAAEPVLHVPGLADLRVAPAGYLLLTKQCGLVYKIVHWHKNLEDLYFLRDRIPEIPRYVAELASECVDDSRRMYAQRHAVSAGKRSCHPALDWPGPSELHAALHRQLGGAEPRAADAEAWDAFPELPGVARRQQMIELLAEEAQVLAAEELLRRTTDAAARLATETVFLRWALRELATGDLPLGWRYFVVNHYREIRERIEHGWSRALDELPPDLLPELHATTAGTTVCTQRL